MRTLTLLGVVFAAAWATAAGLHLAGVACGWALVELLNGRHARAE